MTKLTDAEINLAVARKMYPHYTWTANKYGDAENNDGLMLNYLNPHNAFEMAVWLAKCDEDNSGSYPALQIADMLAESDPQHALAMAIIEVDV